MIDELRNTYMELGELCKLLFILQRKSTGFRAVQLETARDNLVSARWNIWKTLKDEVMIKWCNDTETPEPGAKYPPKDMPRNKT